jgi:hypothetical protein
MDRDRYASEAGNRRLDQLLSFDTRAKVREHPHAMHGRAVGPRLLLILLMALSFWVAVFCILRWLA